MFEPKSTEDPRVGPPDATEVEEVSVGRAWPGVETPAAPGRNRTYEEVFLTEYPVMVKLAVLLVDEVDVAEELVQDAFVRLHEHWRSVDNPGGYLRASVVNRCRNELRRRDRERRFRRRIGPSEPVELGADEVLDAIAALPYKRRAAVVLRFYGGHSEAEIAETLGVRRGTVKSMLHRALAELRVTLG